MIYDAIRAERARQTALWGDQTAMPIGLPASDPAGAVRRDEALLRLADARARHYRAEQAGRLTFLHVLAEEVAEVWAAPSLADARAELVQVAAVCVQMLEAIDRGARA